MEIIVTQHLQMVSMIDDCRFVLSGYNWAHIMESDFICDIFWFTTLHNLKKQIIENKKAVRPF